LTLSTKEEYIAQCMAGTEKTREECEHLWDEANTPPTTDQQTKEEYITECMTGGKTREECEAAWNESHQPSADYATLLRRNEMMKVKLDQTMKMLREATKIIKAVNAERDAVTEARKYEIAVEIERDSEGKLKHTNLMSETLKDLSIMKKAIDVARPKDFTSVSSLLEESARRKKPKLTVGQWNPDTKQYEGGT